MIIPYRFQLRRTKGWRMPTGGRSCARPSRWGNPFTGPDAVERFRLYLRNNPDVVYAAQCEDLAGVPLGCWCGLDQNCHVDVWLEVLNHEFSP